MMEGPLVEMEDPQDGPDRRGPPGPRGPPWPVRPVIVKQTSSCFEYNNLGKYI